MHNEFPLVDTAAFAGAAPAGPSSCRGISRTTRLVDWVIQVQSRLTNQSLEEDEDRAKYQGNAPEYAADGVRGSLRLANQIEQEEANDQEDDELFDPCHLGLLTLPVLIADYLNTLLDVHSRWPGCSPAQVTRGLLHDQGGASPVED